MGTGRKVQQKEIRAGFWWSKSNPDLPFPVPHRLPLSKDQQDFLDALSKVQTFAHRRVSKGWSTCRLCGCKNGSGEYEYKNMKWPDGFMHYIEDHNVTPPQDFREAIMKEVTIKIKKEVKPTATAKKQLIQITKDHLKDLLRSYLKIDVDHSGWVTISFDAEEITTAKIRLGKD